VENWAGTARLVVFDVATDTPTPVTTNSNWETFPVWSPDGQAIACSGDGALKMKRKERGWADEPLLPAAGTDATFLPSDLSPDGASLVGDGGDPAQVRLLSIADRKVRPLIESPAVVRQPTVSPDGRFLAFVSTLGGPSEVFVQPFPGGGERRQVSQGGGFSPRFSRDGREIFYLRGDRMMMAAPLDARTGTATAPRALFRAATRVTYTAAYDVAPDGRFVLLLDQDNPPPLLIIRDWTPLLEPGER
jgi:Tol biopolymer transport system component